MFDRLFDILDKFDFQSFPDRPFALGAGIYIGSWGVHIYLDFLRWCLSFESKAKGKRIDVQD
jgi:hypothetical protein